MFYFITLLRICSVNLHNNDISAKHFSSLQPEIPFSSSCNTESEKDFSSSQSSSFKAPDSGIRNRRTLKRSDCISSQ